MTQPGLRLLLRIRYKTGMPFRDDEQPRTPLAAWRALLTGNRRWVSGDTLHPRTSAERRRATAAAGQTPFATVLACSDSRVPVELLFDRGVGDLFTIRVAGNVANTDQVASIEYAVDQLRTPLVLVLGHTRCGAVTAVCEQTGLVGSIPELLSELGVLVDQERELAEDDMDPELFVEKVVVANVFASLRTLLEQSALLRQHVRAESLLLLGALYELETGRVHRLGRHPLERDLL